MSNDIKRLLSSWTFCNKNTSKNKVVCVSTASPFSRQWPFSLLFSLCLFLLHPTSFFLFQFLNALIIFNIFFRPFSNLPFNFKPKLDSVPLMPGYNTSPRNKSLGRGVVSEQRYMWPWIGGSLSLSEFWDWRPVSRHCPWRSPASSWGLWLVTKAGPWLRVPLLVTDWSALGFPGCSDGKHYACNVGDLG